MDAALEGRPDLRAELDALLEIATTLADAVAEAPPPALRARLLDAIADTPQLPAEVAPAPAAAPSSPIAPVVPITSARRRRWTAVVGVAAAVGGRCSSACSSCRRGTTTGRATRSPPCSRPTTPSRSRCPASCPA